MKICSTELVIGEMQIKTGRETTKHTCERLNLDDEPHHILTRMRSDAAALGTLGGAVTWDVDTCPAT